MCGAAECERGGAVVERNTKNENARRPESTKRTRTTNTNEHDERNEHENDENEPHALTSHDGERVTEGLATTNECRAERKYDAGYESSKQVPLIPVGEREISNHSSHESLSAGRVHFAEHGPVDSHDGAQGRETNETRGIREISKGNAGNRRVGMTKSCGDDQKRRSRRAGCDRGDEEEDEGEGTTAAAKGENSLNGGQLPGG